MPLYIKKPIQIKAFKYDGHDETIKHNVPKVDLHYFNRHDNGNLSIHTLEGTLTAAVGDYVIKGVRGEYYSCKPDIFNATYELIDKD